MQTGRRFLESLDVFDKFSEVEYRVTTTSGAILSMALSFFGSFLFAVQVTSFLIPDLSRNLGAARTTPGETTIVNISLTILVSFPCHFLHLDTQDALGFSQLYANTVTLRRFSRNGTFLGYAPYPNRSACERCFGARPEGECCNSCEELVLLHRLKGLKAEPDKWPQCRNAGMNMPTMEENCHLKGKLTVNRVPGVFAVRFTRSLYNASEFQNFNISHILGRIRFGPKLPWTSTPLEAIRVIQKSEQPLHYFYDLMSTPVLFVRNEDVIERSYEYTTIATARKADPKIGRFPGLFFWYQFTPYTVTVRYRTKPLSSFISATFGVLSGGFAIMAFVDRFLYQRSSKKVLE
jgi:hypothetical protein